MRKRLLLRLAKALNLLSWWLQRVTWTTSTGLLRCDDLLRHAVDGHSGPREWNQRHIDRLHERLEAVNAACADLPWSAVFEVYQLVSGSMETDSTARKDYEFAYEMMKGSCQERKQPETSAKEYWQW
jgi:hypothetical protein